MKALYIGIVLVIISILSAFILRDWTLLYKITGIIGILSLGVSALFSGAFVDGDRMGRNLYSENKDTKQARFFLTNRILLIGLPNIITAILTYFVIK
ncbi:hypothetical protein CU633_03575 [Bacillus sp. V3-13]|uniref:DUF5316 domain-containing protein n=1 Tax=Bacillus sp. V3-13 TaxID=2053728 RepID=UPI000C76C212|nr:DUF5316 domain-containing protein [Bacillus sp. V3-13]PLR78882.1 hypothetical protein CU633_03575 [Bacillus sp. V3-13]